MHRNNTKIVGGNATIRLSIATSDSMETIMLEREGESFPELHQLTATLGTGIYLQIFVQYVSPCGSCAE